MYFPLKTAKLEQALKGLYSSLAGGNNITSEAINTYATKSTIAELNKFYRDNHIDYKVITDLGTKIENLPYNQTIDLTCIKGSRLRPHKLMEGQITAVDYLLPYGKYNERYGKLGVLDKTVTLPMITDADGVGWMTPVYFEETTMRPAVEAAHGHVLKFGLGIGFFPFNCLLKENVQKVTIIEKDLGIIETFKRDLLPQFPRKEDIEIIHGDAFEFLDNEFLQGYDFVYIDIWRNNEDGLIILSNLLSKMDMTTASNKAHIQYWIEDTILQELLATLGVYLKHAYTGDLPRYLTGTVSSSNEILDFITLDKIHNYMQAHHADVQFKTEKELLTFVKDREFLMSLLCSLTVK